MDFHNRINMRWGVAGNEEKLGEMTDAASGETTFNHKIFPGRKKYRKVATAETWMLFGIMNSEGL